MDKTVSVILPVYNEENNIESIVKSVVTFLPHIVNNFEIILVNDGSNDETYSIIKRLAKDISCIKAVHHSKNVGYGGALNSGFRVAQYPLIFFMDSDGQFEISEMNKLLPYAEQFDIIVGTRGVRNDPLYRVLIGKIYNSVIRLLFGIKIKDITCGFKLIKKRIFDKIELKSKSGFINAEILTKAKRIGYSIKEVKIRHFPRNKGQQTGANLKTVIIKISEALRLWKELIK